jgi:hypothetical protein
MIFVIQTDDEIAGLDITNALSLAGIKHTIVSKQHDEATQQSVHPTGLNVAQKEEVRQMIQSALDTGSA